jgi:hypothetical protein
MKTTNGKRGGNLVGKPHNDKSGNPVGGIKAQVTDAGGKPVELEGGEVIINKEASKKHWKELSRINQSAGNGVPINPPIDPHDEDPVDYEEGGKIIEFNRNHIPNKWILGYAKSIKKDHPEIWTLGGNIFGNTAFENLSRVSERGYWLDSEKWMYIKWRSYVARHAHDFRIEGVVAMLKWVDKVDKGWKYMKDLIEDKISKSKAKPKSMKDGGSVITYKMKFNKKYGFDSNESHSLAEIAKLTKLKLSALQDIYDKGIGAYKTNPQSVRPNVKSKEQWAMARVYSAVMGGKAAKVDANELERGKKYADGGSVGFENMLFTELAEHDAPSFKGGGLVDSYKRAMTNLEINGIVVYDDESETVVIAYNDGLHKRKLGIYNLNLIYKTIAIIDEDAASRIIVNINQGIFDEFDKNKVIDYNKYKTLVIINQFEVIYNSTQHDAPRFKVGGELAKGIKAEMEHKGTIDRFKREGISDKDVAKSIAEDHLKEDSRYYTKLLEMESKMATGGLIIPDKKKFYSFMSDESGVGSFKLIENAKPVIINNVDGEFFSYKDSSNYYTIIEATRGMGIDVTRKKLSDAIKVAEEKITSFTKTIALQDVITRAIERNGLSPRYEVGEEKPKKERKPRQPKPPVAQNEPAITDFSKAAFSLITPTREPSRLTYLQQILVRTKAFKDFFGDWETAAKQYLADNRENWDKHYNTISKCIDFVTLEPKLVYHGTRVSNEFFEFDVTMQTGVGRPYAYFAHNREYSDNFTQVSQRQDNDANSYLYSVFLNTRRPFMALGSDYEQKTRNAEGWFQVIVGTIVWDYFKTTERNEITIKIENAVRSQIFSFIDNVIGQSYYPFWTLMARDRNGEFKAFLMSYKYDSVFYGEEIKVGYDVSNPAEYTNAVTIFNPNDIKLGDGRNLNFNPMKADIRLENGGNLPVDNSEQNTQNDLTKKEQLASTLFGGKFENGGSLNIVEQNFIAKDIQPVMTSKSREYVEDLIKKMKL